MFIIFLLYDWTTQEIQIYIYLILYLTQFCNLINKQKKVLIPRLAYQRIAGEAESSWTFKV